MKRLRSIGCAALGVASLVAAEANAACTFDGSSEPSLQNTLDGIFGADSPNAITGCISDGADKEWSTIGQIGTIEIHVELAGNASSNTFGVYDPITGTEVRLFEGDDGAGVLGIVEISATGSGQWRVRVLDSNRSGAGDTRWSGYTNISSSVVGFYLGTQSNGTFYSDTTRNADGFDHMYAYGPMVGDSANQYAIAWEDLNGGGDRDYQDFVAVLQDITPVPLPAAAWLLMSGMVGLVGVSRRRA